MNYKKLLKNTIFYPLVRLKRIYEGYLMVNNPAKLMQMRYKNNMGIKLDLENPKNLDEKINFMSFYTDTSLWSKMADKVLVREYVTESGFPEILNEFYGVYKSPDEIDFDNLPEKFVLKTNHASATNIFVKEKSKIDVKEIKNKFKDWLKIDYGLKTATPHYSKIQPQIIAEKFLLQDHSLDKSLTDYKIYCFNGVPHYIFVFADRISNTHEYAKMIYDKEWKPMPNVITKGMKLAKVQPKPKSLDKMLEMASVLSKPFPFVRVDFYEIEDRPIFSELTFTPGHNSAANPEFLLKMGSMINLSLDKRTNLR